MMYLLESSICMIIFYTLYYLIYRGAKTHSANRIYLIISLLLSLIIPLLSFAIYSEIIVIPDSIQISAENIISGSTPSNTTNWSSVLMVLYSFGVIVSLFILMKNVFEIFQIIRQGNIIIGKGSKLVYTNLDISVCSFGRYIIVPQSRKDKITDYELVHEENHIRRHHSLDILLMKIVRSFFWFNPILVLYERDLIEIHEYQADEATIGKLGTESYLSFLLNQVSNSHQYPLVHNFNSLIKKRLIMMSSKTRSGKTKYFAVLPVLLGILCLFSFDTFPVLVDSQGNYLSISQDSIPPGASIDTITMYNYKLKKEVNRIIVSPNGADAYLLQSTNPDITSMDWIDTIVTIDYDTYLEEMVVINYQTGVIDTIK